MPAARRAEGSSAPERYLLGIRCMRLTNERVPLEKRAVFNVGKGGRLALGPWFAPSLTAHFYPARSTARFLRTALCPPSTGSFRVEPPDTAGIHNPPAEGGRKRPNRYCDKTTGRHGLIRPCRPNNSFPKYSKYSTEDYFIRDTKPTFFITLRSVRPARADAFARLPYSRLRCRLYRRKGGRIPPGWDAGARRRPRRRQF